MHSTFCTQFKGRINEKYRQKMSVVSISRCRCTHRRRDQCKNLIFFSAVMQSHTILAHIRVEKRALYPNRNITHSQITHHTHNYTLQTTNNMKTKTTNARIYISISSIRWKNLFLFSYGTFGYFDFQIDTWFYRILFYSGLTWV